MKLPGTTTAALAKRHSTKLNDLTAADAHDEEDNFDSRLQEFMAFTYPQKVAQMN